MIVLEKRSLGLRAERDRASTGCSFVIDKGEFVFVVGASGSGSPRSSGCS
jgi:ABC-type lipoprotein export system ATPase subunit